MELRVSSKNDIYDRPFLHVIITKFAKLYVDTTRNKRNIFRTPVPYSNSRTFIAKLNVDTTRNTRVPNKHTDAERVHLINWFKLGCPIMLMRNMDPHKGHWSGTNCIWSLNFIQTSLKLIFPGFTLTPMRVALAQTKEIQTLALTSLDKTVADDLVLQDRVSFLRWNERQPYKLPVALIKSLLR